MTGLIKDTLGEALVRTAERWPQRPAVIYQGEAMSYRVLLLKARQIAKGLVALGVGRGTRVAVWETDRPNTVVCLYALWLIGAVAVMPNTSLGVDEMARLLRASRTEILLYGSGYKDLSFYQVVARLPPMETLRCAFFIGEDRAPERAPGLKDIQIAGRSVSTDDLRQMSRAISPGDAATLLFTSGTTGDPKGVLTSHYARLNSARCQADDLSAVPEDRFLTATPLFHCFSMTVNLLGAMTCGACILLPKDRHTRTLLECIDQEHCTILCAVPALFQAMLARPDFGGFDLSSLRIGLVGGASADAALMRMFRDRFAYELLPSLGQTEATGGITVASPADALAVKLETVGHFMEHIEGKIVDPCTGETLPLGRVGEIAVRGYCLMLGYDGLPQETDKAIDGEGFLHTGDLGFLDEAGNLHLRGRLKEIINRGGENIDPVEIENCLLADGRIQDVCVVGVPDAHYGEAICACVVLSDGATLDGQALRQLVADQLAYYKIPQYVQYWDKLPGGQRGKRPRSAIRVGACAVIGQKAD